MVRPGHVFIFEGADGVGKSRRCRQTVAFLRQLGVACESFAFPGKQPGTLGALVERLQFHPEQFGLSPLIPGTLQTLQIAVQLEVVERQIKPLLKTGRSVVIDRFWWSSWVYGTAMGANSKVLEQVIEIGRMIWSTVTPSVVFLIDRNRPWRPELSLEKFRRLSTLYRTIASKESDKYRVHVISHEHFGNTQQQIQNIVRDTVNEKPAPLSGDLRERNVPVI